MMCSSATALHALNKARLQSSDSVAIFGFGGLGFSALQLASARGCREVYVVDINPAKLASIAAFGGTAIDATASDPVEQIRAATGGKGVDVSIELVGSAMTMGQAVRCLGIFGRAALVGLTAESMSVLPYHRDHQQRSRDHRRFRSSGGRAVIPHATRVQWEALFSKRRAAFSRSRRGADQRGPGCRREFRRSH